MYVVKVVPISRGSFKESLSFFSKTPLPEGAVIDAPVRNKPTHSLVIETTSAREQKLSLRDSSFSLKKIAPRTVKKIIRQETFAAFKDIARHHALPLGKVIAHLVPSAVVSSSTNTAFETIEHRNEETAPDTLVLQAEYEERVRMYRNLTRESFARNESIVIIAPTIAEAETLYKKLYRGIEEQVVLITSALTKKSLLSSWKHALSENKPCLFIGTYSLLSLPRHDVSAIVVERESARSYLGRERPHIDVRTAAECIAQHTNARLIYADFPLRIETRARFEQGELEELTRLQVSSRHDGLTQIVDARKKESEQTKVKKKKFTIFTEEAEQAIRSELKRGGRIFIYASRKGLAPLTICNDCGTPVTDPSTGTPMTLHKTDSGNVFLSYRSGAILPSNISCKHCSSWNLVSLGIGIERVFEEVEKLFKEHTAFLLTADTANTHAKAKKVQKYFFGTPGAILVGTDRALPYLSEPIELSVVASIDSLLSISAWRAHEYALATLFYIRDRTQDTLLIQTRQDQSEVMRAIATGNPTEFIRNEMKDRKTYGYPPFATFIGLTWTGTEKKVQNIADVVKHTLSEWDLVGPLPARSIGRNKFLSRAVVRLERHRWPHAKLIPILKSLAPDVTVAVDPDEIV